MDLESAPMTKTPTQQRTPLRVMTDEMPKLTWCQAFASIHCDAVRQVCTCERPTAHVEVRKRFRSAWLVRILHERFRVINLAERSVQQHRKRWPRWLLQRLHLTWQLLLWLRLACMLCLGFTSLHSVVVRNASDPFVWPLNAVQSASVEQ